ADRGVRRRDSGPGHRQLRGRAEGSEVPPLRSGPRPRPAWERRPPLPRAPGAGPAGGLAFPIRPQPQPSPPMFEHRLSPLLPLPEFRARLAKMAALGFALIAASLVVGMLGYHYVAEKTWPDSFLNAAMILSGMGPIGDLSTTGAKTF